MKAWKHGRCCLEGLYCACAWVTAAVQHAPWPHPLSNTRTPAHRSRLSLDPNTARWVPPPQPLVLEEFGKNVSDQNPSTIESVRNPVFRTVMGALNDSLAAGDVLKGAMYWMWDSVLVDESSNGWERFSQDQVGCWAAGQAGVCQLRGWWWWCSSPGVEQVHLEGPWEPAAQAATGTGWDRRLPQSPPANPLPPTAARRCSPAARP